MNASAIGILTDPHPGGHIVYPYTDERLVADAVTLFARAGLDRGEAVILVMTAAHWGPIMQRLASEGVDTEGLQQQGRLVCLIAEDLLAELLVDDSPDEERFRQIVGGIIDRCRAGMVSGEASPVRVFGEMVSLLWDPNLKATISLEEMWNRLIDTHKIALLCTYGPGAGRDYAFVTLPSAAIFQDLMALQWYCEFSPRASISASL